MRQIMVIAGKDLKETLRTGPFYIYSALAFVFAVVVGIRALGGVVGGRIDALIEEGFSPAQVVAAIEPIMGTILFMFSLVLIWWLCMYGSLYNLTMEKTKRSLESLLCTPLRLRQVCLGKSLAIFLPSVTVGLLLAFAAIAGADQLLLAPQIGRSIMPGGPLVTTTLIAVPVIAFCFVSLLVTLQLMIAKIQWVNGVLAGLVGAVMIALNYGLFRFGLEPWSIVVVSLTVAAVLALVTIFLFRLATKERIVLSSRG